VGRLSLPFESYSNPPSSTAKMLNCYIEQLPPDAKSPTLLTRSPGIAAWSTVGNGPIHAMIAATILGTKYLFVVSGSKLYKVDALKNATLLGDIGSVSSTGLDIDRNATAVIVVNEPNAFYYDGTTFAQITDPDFTSRGASGVEFDANYLLFVEPDSGRFFGSDLGDETAYDALNFVTAEGVPDNLVGMKVDHQQAVALGEESIEIWQNTGIAGFPYERVTNGFVEIGCFNGRTAAKLDNSVAWLANDYTVRRLDGVTPVRISHHGVEQSIQEVSIASAQAYSYTRSGHLFYVLSFPEITWVYDATTQKWHNRETYGTDNWAASCHAQAFGLELVGNNQTNQVGELRSDTYTEWGDTQRAHWVYQPVYSEGVTAFHDRLEIVCKTGVGLTTGQGSDPVIMLDYSDDGGLTWNALPNKSLGPIGQYRKKVEWRALGNSPQRVYRAAVSDPVELQIVDTVLDVRGGRV
jgi:hypothetical protein